MKIKTFITSVTAICLSFALVFGMVFIPAEAASAAVPELGTYVSEDNNFTIEILSANPNNGQIEATYSATYSPIGEFTALYPSGNYGWVRNDQGQAGVAPFYIQFRGFQRPSGFPYVISDVWTGAYEVGDTLLMEGVRSYVNSSGVVEVRSLGTLKFSQ